MNLSMLKEMMLLPQKEIHIKKSTVMNGIEVHFMCLTQTDDTRTLWAIYENKYEDLYSDQYEDFHDPKTKTNRTSLTQNIERAHIAPQTHISKFNIQGQCFTVSSSSSSPIDYTNPENILKLQHFMENDLLPDALLESELRNICIAAYTQDENEASIQIDPNHHMDMEIIIQNHPERALINEVLTVRFSQSSIQKHTFYNPLTQQNCIYYLHPLEIHDFWKEFETSLKEQDISEFAEEPFQSMYKNIEKSIEKVCPKDMKLALLKYETDKDISLQFYTKEILDKVPLSSEISQEESSDGIISSSSVGFIFSPDEKQGPNGLSFKLCELKPVKDDQEQDFEIELFSVMKISPEIKIKF